MGSFVAVSYNIRHAVLDDGRDAWAVRRRGVVSLIESLGPDLLALQESTGDQQRSMERALAGYEWVGVADEPGTGEHNPVGVNGRFRVRTSTTEWLSETPAGESVGWDAAYPRVLTRVELEWRRTGQRLAVYNVHFDHQGPTARRHSARLVRDRVDRLPSETEAVVLGDFNCRPDETPYLLLTDGSDNRELADARDRAATVEGPRTTVTNFETPVPGRQLDHVFVTSGLTVGSYRVCDRTEGDRFPSDHLPVAVELEFA